MEIRLIARSLDAKCNKFIRRLVTWWNNAHNLTLYHASVLAPVFIGHTIGHTMGHTTSHMGKLRIHYTITPSIYSSISWSRWVDMEIQWPSLKNLWNQRSESQIGMQRAKLFRSCGLANQTYSHIPLLRAATIHPDESFWRFPKMGTSHVIMALNTI